MTWDAARAALTQRLLSLEGLDPAKVAWPNRVFPASGQSLPTDGHWRVDFLPAGVSPVNSGTDHEYGIFQVSRFVPVGNGIESALVDVQSVVSHFRNQNLSGVACGVPVPAPYLQEATRLHFPISIPFQVL